MSKTFGTILAVVASAVLISVLVAPTATADYKTGRYEGTTSQSFLVSFEARKLGVDGFRVRHELDCEDGSQQGFDVRQTRRARVNHKGKFKITFKGDGGAVVKGKLKHKLAKGTLRSEGENEAGVACSNRVSWRARKQ